MANHASPKNVKAVELKMSASELLAKKTFVCL